MIQLTRINSQNKNAPKLIIISGGPGLSSHTLRDLDILRRSFELIYVDIQGTNESSYVGRKSFTEIASELAQHISKEPGTKFSIGHSYGGFLAAELFIREAVSGLVCISTPFSRATLSSAKENFNTHKASALIEAEADWSKKQSDFAFAKWLSEYGDLYFKSPRGRQILLNDKVSANFFRDNRSDAIDRESMLESLSLINQKKIFIAGKDDKILPPSVLRNDSAIGKFDFIEVDDASHFVFIDQPEKVAKIIEFKLLQS